MEPSPPAAAWLAAVGAVSLLGQFVLLREIHVALYGTELVYLLALGLWLLGTSCGAAMGRASFAPSPSAVRRLLLATAVLITGSVALARGSRILLGAVPGAYLSLPRQVAAMSMTIVPSALLLGLLFVFAASVFVSRGRSLAAAYAVESAGGIAGGALALALPLCGVSNLTTGFVAAALALCGAAWPGRDRSRVVVGLAAALGLLLVAGAASGGALDRWMTSWTHPDVVATADSPYARVTLTRSSGQVAIFENDALAYESEGTSAEELVHLALLQSARPDSVLVLGGGIEGLVDEALRHRPVLLEYVELDDTVRRLAAPELPAGARAALADPAVRAVTADPRSFVATTAGWDAILVGMPEPDSGRTNRFYTAEFFAACSRSLRHGGVLALRLRGAENLWTPLATRRLAAIHRALRSAFDDVMVIPGTTHVLVASRGALSRDPVLLAERLRRRDLRARLVTPAYVTYLLTNDRFVEMERALASAWTPSNTDARPVCYPYTLLLWLSRFVPSLGRAEIPDIRPARLLADPRGWLALAAVAGLAALARRRGFVRRSALVGAVACAAMVIETVLLLDYQTRSGALFRDLGALMTAFMMGLAAGALWLGRRTQRAGAKNAGLRLVLALTAIAVGTVWLLERGDVLGLVPVAILLAATGFVVAAVFAWAAAVAHADPRVPIAPLYAADLAGGCLGSLGAALALVPLAGLPGAVELVAPLLLAAAILA